jgi:murein tripeptide amidase MpaA
MKSPLISGLMLVALCSPLSDSLNLTRIITMPLDEYRRYQTLHGPLDRLMVQDGLGYFLIDYSRTIEETMAGFEHQIEVEGPGVVPPSPASGSGDINGAFHDSFETEAALRDLALRHPDRAEFMILGHSVEGRPITALRIGSFGANERPAVYVLGCHHAREWISVEVPLHFARHLLEAYDQDSRIRRCVDEANIYIVPLVNPDGLEYSILRYRYWRKNRIYNGRFSWGVDLNRNYAHQWGLDNTGSSPNPGNATYRGRAPFSEPETVALRDFMLLHPPSGLISYHNFSQIILYPWGYTREPAARAPEMRELAGRMSAEMEGVNGRRYDFGSASDALYLTNGDTTDWVYSTFSAIAFTIELPPPSQMGHFITDEDEIESICQENRPALLCFIEHFIRRSPTDDEEGSVITLPEALPPPKG